MKKQSRPNQRPCYRTPDSSWIRHLLGKNDRPSTVAPAGAAYLGLQTCFHYYLSYTIMAIVPLFGLLMAEQSFFNQTLTSPFLGSTSEGSKQPFELPPFYCIDAIAKSSESTPAMVQTMPSATPGFALLWASRSVSVH